MAFFFLGEQISGQDKPSAPMAVTPTSNSFHKPRHHPVPVNNVEISQQSTRLSQACRFSAYEDNPPQGHVFLSSP